MKYEVLLFNEKGNHVYTHSVDAETQFIALDEAKKHATLSGIKHDAKRATINKGKLKA